MATIIHADFEDEREQPTRDLVDEVCGVVRGINGLEVDNQKVDAGRKPDGTGSYARFPVEQYDTDTDRDVVSAVRKAFTKEIDDFDSLEEL